MATRRAAFYTFWSVLTLVSAAIGVQTGAAYSMMDRMNAFYVVTRVSFCWSRRALWRYWLGWWLLRPRFGSEGPRSRLGRRWRRAVWVSSPASVLCLRSWPRGVSCAALFSSWTGSQSILARRSRALRSSGSLWESWGSHWDLLSFPRYSYRWRTLWNRQHRRRWRCEAVGLVRRRSWTGLVITPSPEVRRTSQFWNVTGHPWKRVQAWRPSR